MARGIIQQVLQQEGARQQLYNLNFPTSAMTEPRGLKIVPMGVERYGEHFIRRRDPRGRTYFWATSDPPPKREGCETDLTALANGYVTLTPLDFDLTKQPQLQQMRHWGLSLPACE